MYSFFIPHFYCCLTWNIEYWRYITLLFVHPARNWALVWRSFLIYKRIKNLKKISLCIWISLFYIPNSKFTLNNTSICLNICIKIIFSWNTSFYLNPGTPFILFLWSMYPLYLLKITMLVMSFLSAIEDIRLRNSQLFYQVCDWFVNLIVNTLTIHYLALSLKYHQNLEIREQVLFWL